MCIIIYPALVRPWTFLTSRKQRKAANVWGSEFKILFIIWYKNGLCKKWMGTWTCTILTKYICNVIQRQTHKAQHSVWPWLCQRIHLIKIYRFFTQYFSLYTFIGLYGYIYMNIKCKNKNTCSEGMALKCCIWQHACLCTRVCVCVCVWDAIHVQYGWMDRLSHTHTHRYADTHWIWPRLDWRQMKFNLFPARRWICSSSSFVYLQYIWVCAISWVIQIQLIGTAEKTS